MFAIDFEYDGQYLSDYGFMIYDDMKDETVSPGSKIVFNKIPLQNGKYHSLSSAKYEECYTTSFAICKNPDLYFGEDRIITNDEYRDLIRWLNRKEFLKFCFMGEDEATYYNASFLVDKIYKAGLLRGLQLTLETNSPFGYGQEQSVKWTISETSTAKILTHISDEIGDVCPDLKISCNRNGDFEIYNETTNSRMIIKNCTVGETITIKGDTRIIETDNEVHRKNIYHDFNFEFFRIGNTIDNRNNKITVSLPSVVEIKYTPIIK